MNLVLHPWPVCSPQSHTVTVRTGTTTVTLLVLVLKLEFVHMKSSFPAETWISHVRLSEGLKLNEFLIVECGDYGIRAEGQRWSSPTILKSRQLILLAMCP